MDLNETRERIIYQKDGPIAKITLNWPEKANAQDQKLAEEVDAALLDADRDYDIKVLVLKANGKGFCSGHAIGNNAVDYPAFVENAMVTGHPWKAQSDLFVKPTLNLWQFEAHHRAGARLLCGRRYAHGSDHRHRHRLRGRLLLLPAPAGVRHAIR